MNKYRYKVYNGASGYTWDTVEIEIIARNLREAKEKAFALSLNHDFQEQMYPYLLPLTTSFYMVERGV